MAMGITLSCQHSARLDASHQCESPALCASSRCHLRAMACLNDNPKDTHRKNAIPCHLPVGSLIEIDRRSTFDDIVFIINSSVVGYRRPMQHFDRGHSCTAFYENL